MKKMAWVAAVAALAFPAWCGEGLESENCVGFNTFALSGQNRLVGGAFVNVAGSELSITALRISGSNATGTKLQWFDGERYQSALWYDATGWDKGMAFAPGQGFWIRPSVGSENVKLLASGEVVMENTTEFLTATITKGQAILSHPLPVELPLTNVTLSANVPVNGSTMIKWYNGNTYGYAYWCNLYKDNGNGTEEALGKTGWGDIDWYERNDINNKTFAPGEAFWVMIPALDYKGIPGDEQKAQVKFPNPFYPKDSASAD